MSPVEGRTATWDINGTLVPVGSLSSVVAVTLMWPPDGAPTTGTEYKKLPLSLSEISSWPVVESQAAPPMLPKLAFCTTSGVPSVPLGFTTSIVLDGVK